MKSGDFNTVHETGWFEIYSEWWILFQVKNISSLSKYDPLID